MRPLRWRSESRPRKVGLGLHGSVGCVRNGNRDLVDALPRTESPRLARTDVEQPGCTSFNIGDNFRFRNHFACSEREK
jgi:hypothetical protein